MLSQKLLIQIPSRFGRSTTTTTRKFVAPTNLQSLLNSQNGVIKITTTSKLTTRHLNLLTTATNNHDRKQQDLAKKISCQSNCSSNNTSKRWLSEDETSSRCLDLNGNRNNSQLDDGVADKTARTSSQLPEIMPYVDPKLSYSFGRSMDKLIYSTISKELWRELEESAENANRLAFVSDYEGISKTLKEFYVDVNTIAKILLTRFHLKKGDSVGIYGYNSYNWIVTQFACSRIGVIVVPINPSYKADELAFVLQSSKVRCLFTHGPKSVQNELNKHLEWLKSDLIKEKINSGELSDLTDIVLMDGKKSSDYANYDFSNSTNSELFVHKQCNITHWDDCLHNGRLYTSLEEAKLDNNHDGHVLDLDEVSPNDCFAIYYTSGTTGTPKGACVSHFASVNNCRIVIRRMRTEQEPNWQVKMATVLPFFHIYAGVLICYAPLLSNATMIIPSYKYDIGAVVDSMLKHQTNVTSITPTILIDMLRYIKAKNLGDKIPLELVQSGGAALPPEMVNRSFEILKNLKHIRIGYGSTENAALATMQTILEPDDTKAVSVGSPIDFSEIRIVRYDTDELVELGDRGEVQTRGHNTMLGYLNDREKTDNVLTPNNWYRTGDIGLMYPNGSISIVGRLKSLIIRGGENIYPDEVERFIYKLNYVDTVHVVGIPDKRVGEQVCAWIKLKAGFCEMGSQSKQLGDKEITKEEVIKFCLDNMTYFKVPKYILFVDSFPMTPTKKTQAHVMSQMSIETLGLDKITDDPDG